jgi:hypothetical protein
MSANRLPAQEQRPDQELDRRYGAIGISAVAAAVRYQGGAKREADARAANPAADKKEQRPGRAA